MKYKDIQELFRIAKDLDRRGLFKEADALDKFAADIINFEERAKALRSKRKDSEPSVSDDSSGELLDLEDKRDEKRAIMIEEFVKKNVAPDAKIYDADGAHELSDFAYNDSVGLQEYMIEVLPDKIADLYHDLGESDVDQLFQEILYAAETLAVASKDDSHYSEDFSFLAGAMKFYLSDYDFGV